MALLCPVLKQQFSDADGIPLASGKVYTYQAGTLVNKDTYTDATGNTANTNPIILDAGGFSNIWLDGAYKFRVYDLNDAFQYETDNVIELSSSNNSFASAYFKWSTVDTQSPTTGTTSLIDGIDTTATSHAIFFDYMEVSGSSAGLAVRVGTEDGIISAADYAGLITLTKGSLISGSADVLNWGGTFSSSPAIGANTYAAVQGLKGGTGIYLNGCVMLDLLDDNSYNITVSTSLNDTGGNSGLWTIVGSGNVFTGNKRITQIELLTENGNTFVGGSWEVKQYANTGSIQGSNQGPFSNEYSSTGTNTYLLTILGGQTEPQSYFDGLEFNFRPENTNTTTAVKVNIHSLGEIDVVLADGSTVPPIGYVNTATVYECVYDANLGKGVIKSPKILSASQIEDEFITTNMINDAAITTAKIDDASVTTAKLADNAVTTAKIVDNAITTNKIADGSITSAKLAGVTGITNSYASTVGQDIAASTTLTFTHGLGLLPKIVTCRAVNVIAEHGYVPGDVLLVCPYRSEGNSDGFAIKMDTSSIKIIIGLDGIKSTTITNTNLNMSDNFWQMYINAFA